MSKILLLILGAVLLASFNSFADRIAGSEFDTGTIITLGSCKDLATYKKMEIKIKIGFNNVIEGNISSYTVLKKNDSTTINCTDLKVGQQIVVGHAQGNDTPQIKNNFTIIDSITIKNI